MAHNLLYFVERYELRALVAAISRPRYDRSCPKLTFHGIDAIQLRDHSFRTCEVEVDTRIFNSGLDAAHGLLSISISHQTGRILPTYIGHIAIPRVCVCGHLDRSAADWQVCHVNRAVLMIVERGVAQG